MKYLYIDTTSNFLYTGVVENDNLICERKIRFDKDLSTMALSTIVEMLNEQAIKPIEISKIILVNGPGSFTGCRIGITIAKTYRHWFTEICNSFLTYEPYNKKTSNAFIEGKNRLCKEIKAFSCGFNNFAIYRARILYISSDGMIPFKKGDNKRRLYQKNKKKKGG
jgi:hypothetical protein